MPTIDISINAQGAVEGADRFKEAADRIKTEAAAMQKLIEDLNKAFAALQQINRAQGGGGPAGGQAQQTAQAVNTLTQATDNNTQKSQQNTQAKNAQAAAQSKSAQAARQETQSIAALSATYETLIAATFKSAQARGDIGRSQEREIATIRQIIDGLNSNVDAEKRAAGALLRHQEASTGFEKAVAKRVKAIQDAKKAIDNQAISEDRAVANLQKFGSVTDTAARRTETLKSATVELSKVVQIALGPLSGFAARLTAFTSLATRGGTALAVGLSTIVGVGGAVVGITKAARAVDELAKQALQLGLNFEKFLSFRFAAALSGINFADFNSSLETLSRRLGDAIDGLGDAEVALQRLDLEASDLAGLDLAQQILLVADAFAEIKDPATEAAIISDLVGRGNQRMANFLRQGSEAIREQVAQAILLGVALDDNAAEAAQSLTDSLTALKEVTLAAGRTIALKLAPFVEGLSNAVTRSSVVVNTYFADLQKISNQDVLALVVKNIEADIAAIEKQIEEVRARNLAERAPGGPFGAIFTAIFGQVDKQQLAALERSLLGAQARLKETTDRQEELSEATAETSKQTGLLTSKTLEFLKRTRNLSSELRDQIALFDALSSSGIAAFEQLRLQQDVAAGLGTFSPENAVEVAKDLTRQIEGLTARERELAGVTTQTLTTLRQFTEVSGDIDVSTESLDRLRQVAVDVAVGIERIKKETQDLKDRLEAGAAASTTALRKLLDDQAKFALQFQEIIAAENDARRQFEALTSGGVAALEAERFNQELRKVGENIRRIGASIPGVAREMVEFAVDSAQATVGLNTAIDQGVAAIEKQQEEIKRRKEEQQKLIQEPFLEAARGIQQAFASTFESIFSGGVDSFKDLAGKIKEIFIKLAAQVAALLVFRPQLVKQQGLGGAISTAASSLFGLGATTAQAQGPDPAKLFETFQFNQELVRRGIISQQDAFEINRQASQDLSTVSENLSQLAGPLQGLSQVGNFFSRITGFGTGKLLQGLSGLGINLTGPQQLKFISTFNTVGGLLSVFAGAFVGNALRVNVAKFTGIGAEIGAAVGTAVGAVVGAIGGPITAALGAAGGNIVGGALGFSIQELVSGRNPFAFQSHSEFARVARGALIGAILGSFIIPGLGTIIGALLGGIAGAIFGGAPEKSKVRLQTAPFGTPQEEFKRSIGLTSPFGVVGFSREGTSGDLIKKAFVSTVLRAIVDIDKAIARVLTSTQIDTAAIALQTTTAFKDRFSQFDNEFFNIVLDRANTIVKSIFPELRVLSDQQLKDEFGIRKGDILKIARQQGGLAIPLAEIVNSVLAEFKKLGKPEATQALVEQITKFVDERNKLLRAIDDLIRDSTIGIPQAEKDLRKLSDAFTEMRRRGEELHLSLQERIRLEESLLRALLKVRDEFNKSIRLRTLDIVNPFQAELERTLDVITKDIVDALVLGVSPTEMQAVIELGFNLIGQTIDRFTQQTISQLDDVIRRFTATSQAPFAQSVIFQNAQKEFDQAVALALAGNAEALTKVPELFEAMIGPAQAVFGSGPKFFEIFNSALADLQNLRDITATVGPQLSPQERLLLLEEAFQQAMLIFQNAGTTLQSEFVDAALSVKQLRQATEALTANFETLDELLDSLGLLPRSGGGGGGFRHGGSFLVAGAGAGDSQLVSFRARPGERVDVITPEQQASGRGITRTVAQEIARGNITVEKLLEGILQELRVIRRRGSITSLERSRPRHAS